MLRVVSGPELVQILRLGDVQHGDRTLALDGRSLHPDGQAGDDGLPVGGVWGSRLEKDDKGAALLVLLIGGLRLLPPLDQASGAGRLALGRVPARVEALPNPVVGLVAKGLDCDSVALDEVFLGLAQRDCEKKRASRMTVNQLAYPPLRLRTTGDSDSTSPVKLNPEVDMLIELGMRSIT